ncbi:MAG: copper chaperone PCu(A)C [Acetobacterales bacterium]
MRTATFLAAACAAALALPAVAHTPAEGRDAHGLKRPAPGLAILAAAGHDAHAGHGDAVTPAVKAGDLEIVGPYLRATPPNAPVAAGYMTIRNTGKAPDRLLGGSAGFAGKVEVHEMSMDGGVMRMREVGSGLEIPAGGEVALAPGGMHLMFMRMTGQLKEGEARTVTLRFEKAGTVELSLPVRGVRGGEHSGHDGHGGHGSR